MALIASAFGLGGSSSSSTTMKQTLDTINDNLFSLTSNVSNSASIDCVSNQTQPINIETLTNKGCNLSFINETNNNCKLQSYFSNTNVTDLKTMLNQAVDQASSSNNEIVQSFLSTSSSSSQDNITNAAKIKNLIDRNFTYDSATLCINSAKNTQSQPINFKTITLDCEKNPNASTVFRQNAELLGFVDCVGSQLNNILSNDSSVLAAAQESDAKNKVTQTGIGEAIAKLIDSIAGPIKWIILGLLIVCAVALIGAVVFLLSPAGQEASKKLVDTAAKKI